MFDIKQHFAKCIEFIHQARLNGGTVLVHCAYGVSRSVTVATAYLATVTGLPWEAVLRAIKRKRACADPNFGFRKQLGEFQAEKVEDERGNLFGKFGFSDAFGERSLIEALDE